MIITLSQVLIFICVIFFIVFNLIAVYLYKENYTHKKIELNNQSLSWEIISNINDYKEWWSKFLNVDHIQNHIKIQEQREGFFISVQINNLSKAVSKENWTFIIKPQKDSHTLLIRKESITNSNFKNFVNKYFLNKSDITLFIKDFKKELAYIEFTHKSKKTI
jgi:hypothetical protein